MENTKKLIIFVPGIFTDFKKSNFVELLNIDSDFDFTFSDFYSKIRKPDIGIKNLADNLNLTIKKNKKKYKNIFIISYSSGSEVVLRIKFPKEVKAITFWSPSFFYPQSISDSLRSYKNSKKILVFGNILINKKLANELDSLDTRKSIKNIKKPICIFSSIEGHGRKSWANKKIFKMIPVKEKFNKNVPYQHKYTKKQTIRLLKMTIKWFKTMI